MILKKFIPFLFLPILFSCSGISKKDCQKDMLKFGLDQGKSGEKKYTDELRATCLSKNPNLNLEDYEKGFYQGWEIYCLPNRAFEMGKKAEPYLSYCPPGREEQFREKYLLGKNLFELKDTESEIVEKINDLRPLIHDSTADYDIYLKLQQELEIVKRNIQKIEIEGNRNSFKFR